jgi:hypothetical protein
VPSVTARARAEAARLLRGADGAAPGAGEARDADAARLGGDGERERPERVRPRGKRVSPALRRLVMTPTFAAGLGVVVAAFLAANMSRTVLHFSAPIPGNQCTSGDCHVQKPHGGTLASARPGVHITPSVPPASGPAAGLQPGGTASAAGGRGAPQPSVGSQPVSITYQQVEQWPGGFADQITIRGLSRTRAGSWSLAFGYPGSRIVGVQGARWERGSPGSGVARGAAWPGWGQAQDSADPVRLLVVVNGQPGAPSGCTLDGAPCTFTHPATP